MLRELVYMTSVLIVEHGDQSCNSSIVGDLALLFTLETAFGGLTSMKESLVKVRRADPLVCFNRGRQL
jgi:hypothetical protein